MGYTKDSVQMHSDGPRPANPAINIKAHAFGDVAAVVARFNCSEAVAERALQWAFQAAQQLFWEDAQGWADETCGGVVYGEGRSGGWAVVHNLPDVEDWDAPTLAKWRSFEKMCKDTVEGLCSEDKILEGIGSNRWAEENAEEFNFVDKDGKTVCLADVPRCAHCK